MQNPAQNFKLRILSIDVGVGTQDIMLFDSGYESAYKIVMPSPTTIFARRIADFAQKKKALVLVGETMGGGPISDAVHNHIKMGLRVYATEPAARTIRDDITQVKKSGVEIVGMDEAMRLCQKPDVQGILTRDVDRDALSTTSSMFNIVMEPETVAVAVEDHGVAKEGQSDRECRFAHFRQLIPGGIEKFAYTTPPESYSRMCGVKRTLERDFPKARHLIVDSKIAAIFGGVFGAGRQTALAIDVGNGHTTVAAIENWKITGILEHHTHMLTPEKIKEYITRFRKGALPDEEIRKDGGHGCYIVNKFDCEDIIVTGPGRELLRGTGLKIDFVNPSGDVFMTGNVGLVEAVKKVFGTDR